MGVYKEPSITKVRGSTQDGLGASSKIWVRLRHWRLSIFLEVGFRQVPLVVDGGRPSREDGFEEHNSELPTTCLVHRNKVLRMVQAKNSQGTRQLRAFLSIYMMEIL